LLALIEAGATLAEAARAVDVSRMTIHRHRRADPAFAVLLGAARRPRGFDPGEPLDWREAALVLESNAPERWALPGDPFDPFDFDAGT
jgi:hypothetical protein